MFKELFPIVERAPLMLMITKDGERLRVHITQKKDDKDDFTPLNLAIAATPEELDAELPMAIAEGAAMLSEEKPKSIADQVKGQVEQAKDAAEEGDKKPSKAKKAAPAPKRKVAAPKKPAASKAVKPPKPAKTPKPGKGKKPSRSEAMRAAYQKKREAEGTAATPAPQITPLLKAEDLNRAAASSTPSTPEAIAIAQGLDAPAEQVRGDLASAPDYKPEPATTPAPKPDGDTVDLFGGA
jgi:PRTRC genetic system protein E